MTSDLIKYYTLHNTSNKHNHNIISHYNNYSIVNFESTLRKALSEYNITVKYCQSPVKTHIYSRLGSSTSIINNSLFISGFYNAHKEIIEIVYKPNNYSMQKIQKITQEILKIAIIEKYSKIYMIIIKCIDIKRKNIYLPFTLGTRTINNTHIINYHSKSRAQAHQVN